MPKGYPGSGKAKKKFYKRGRQVDHSATGDPNVHVVPLTSITRVADILEYMKQGAFILIVNKK